MDWAGRCSGPPEGRLPVVFAIAALSLVRLIALAALLLSPPGLLTVGAIAGALVARSLTLDRKSVV